MGVAYLGVTILPTEKQRFPGPFFKITLIGERPYNSHGARLAMLLNVSSGLRGGGVLETLEIIRSHF